MSRGLLNPKLGKHNLICDISGEKIRSDKYRKTWDGLIVSKDDYDPKHPQLNLRSRSEKISVSPTRVRPPDYFIPKPAAYCSLMSWTNIQPSNSTGVWVGNQLTATNDGGGGGAWVDKGDTTITSATGNISAEIKFVSGSGGGSGASLYLAQGGGVPPTTIVGLQYSEDDKELTDLVGASVIATPTGGAGYYFGYKVDQAAGTATWSDSEGNSGTLTVNGAYNNANASLIVVNAQTSISGITVIETNVGTEAWWLAASSGAYCDY